jgi:hypothetical protein
VLAAQVETVRQGTGMLPDQVVHPIPALGDLGQQVLVIEDLQAPPGGRQVRAVQRVGQQPHRVAVRRGRYVALQVTDGSYTQVWRPGRLLLRQRDTHTEFAQQSAKGNRCLGRVLSSRQLANGRILSDAGRTPPASGSGNHLAHETRHGHGTQP